MRKKSRRGKKKNWATKGFGFSKRCIVPECTGAAEESNFQREIYENGHAYCLIHEDDNSNCGCRSVRKFHCFPKSTDLRKVWFKLIGVDPNYQIRKRDFVCSKHFEFGGHWRVPTIEIGRSDEEIREILDKNVQRALTRNEEIRESIFKENSSDLVEAPADIVVKEEEDEEDSGEDETSQDTSFEDVPGPSWKIDQLPIAKTVDPVSLETEEMPTTCSVVGCSNRSNGRGYSFFRFPRSRETWNRWLQNINRPDWTPTRNSRICSKHFVDGRPTELNPDPVNEMGAEIMNPIKQRPPAFKVSVAIPGSGIAAPSRLLPSRSRIFYQKSGIVVKEASPERALYEDQKNSFMSESRDGYFCGGREILTSREPPLSAENMFSRIGSAILAEKLKSLDEMAQTPIGATAFIKQEIPEEPAEETDGYQEAITVSVKEEIPEFGGGYQCGSIFENDDHAYQFGNPSTAKKPAIAILLQHIRHIFLQSRPEHNLLLQCRFCRTKTELISSSGTGIDADAVLLHVIFHFNNTRCKCNMCNGMARNLIMTSEHLRPDHARDNCATCIQYYEAHRDDIMTMTDRCFLQITRDVRLETAKRIKATSQLDLNSPDRYCTTLIEDDQLVLKTYVCSLCGHHYDLYRHGITYGRRIMIDHVLTHLPVLLFHCGCCPYTSTRSQVLRHLTKVHQCSDLKYTNSIDKHRGEIIRMIDLCFGEELGPRTYTTPVPETSKRTSSSPDGSVSKRPRLSEESASSSSSSSSVRKDFQDPQPAHSSKLGKKRNQVANEESESLSGINFTQSKSRASLADSSVKQIRRPRVLESFRTKHSFKLIRSVSKIYSCCECSYRSMFRKLITNHLKTVHK